MDLNRHRSGKKVVVPDGLTQILGGTKVSLERMGMELVACFLAGLKTYSTRSGTRFPPGAIATAEGVNFSVFSKNAKRVDLLLYDGADSPKPVQVISLDSDRNRSYFFWHVFVEGLPAGTHYTWRVDGGKEFVDPWARAVTDSLWVRRKAVSDVKSACNSIRAVWPTWGRTHRSRRCRTGTGMRRSTPLTARPRVFYPMNVNSRS